ncbi:hypothetical protein ACFODO_03180 [Acinetobacter sichuanensis]|uniref:Uncharacterized protein n=1 Tax=Acinetobacter sichuanensis TaxID=2136183 RepID=A0A371YT20_9GAMM|nr:hypothetical protein [Acinetobacter sichuanensis]RFC84616.1 hypothetical protein C9E89_005040 [Acinetobacter sichuanensis]
MDINKIFTVQTQDLKIKLDNALFFLYEKNNLIKIEYDPTSPLEFDELDKLNEGRYEFLDIIGKTYDLIYQAEKEINGLDDQSYEINLESVQKLAKFFIHQNFKENLDNIMERGLFSSYLAIATSNFAMKQGNYQQTLHCLCNAYNIYGSTLNIKNPFINFEINKISISLNNARRAKIKAEKILQEKAPKLKILEETWDKGNWTAKGRGKFTEFASHIIHSETVDDMSFETIKNHISQYDKKKKSIN